MNIVYADTIVKTTKMYFDDLGNPHQGYRSCTRVVTTGSNPLNVTPGTNCPGSIFSDDNLTRFDDQLNISEETEIGFEYYTGRINTSWIASEADIIGLNFLVTASQDNTNEPDGWSMWIMNETNFTINNDSSLSYILGGSNADNSEVTLNFTIVDGIDDDFISDDDSMTRFLIQNTNADTGGGGGSPNIEFMWS